jgi:hypothetical protein
MQNLPAWIPTPRAWLNGFALVLLMTALQYGISYLWLLLSFLFPFLPDLPKLLFPLSVFFQLLPIFLIAFLHHWLHRALDQFFPESRIPGTEGVQGFFPGLMSWWEGLFGWLVNSLSSLIAFSLIWFLVPFPTTINLWFTIANSEILPLLREPLFVFAQFMTAAYLYQFEYLVHRHLMTTGRD